MKPVDFWMIVLILLQLYVIAGGLRFLGYPAIWRDSEDSVKKAMFIVDPTQKAKRDGVVIGWNVYTSRGRRSQTAHLQIWRLVKGDNTFKLVGQTIFIAQWVGHNYFPLYPSHRIKVKAGDVVGLYFPKYNPIPWSATTCERGNDHIFRYNPRNVEIGREFRFEKSSSDWKPCRAYSINATLADTDEIKTLDEKAVKFPDTRRYHGNFLPTIKPPTSASSVALWGDLCVMSSIAAVISVNRPP